MDLNCRDPYFETSARCTQLHSAEMTRVADTAQSTEKLLDARRLASIAAFIKRPPNLVAIVSLF